jgi:hypothetical protein
MKLSRERREIQKILFGKLEGNNSETQDLDHSGYSDVN